MTLLMAGTNKKYGYIISDTKLNNRFLGPSDNYKKIFFDKTRSCFISGYHSVALCDEFIEKHQNEYFNSTDDLIRFFEDAYKSIDLNEFIKREDLDNSVILNLYVNSDNEVHILYLNHKESLCFGKIKITLYPGDLCGNDNISSPEFEIADEEFDDIMLTLHKNVDKFIHFSELSDEVSDTFCCAILINNAQTLYIEMNMYELKKKLQEEAVIENDINKLLEYQKNN